MKARLFALATLVALTACGGGHTNATTQDQTTTRTTGGSGSMSHNSSRAHTGSAGGAYGGATQGRRHSGAAAGNQPQEFDTEAAAVRRCGSEVVWLNIKTGVYHAKGTEFYGNTKNGAYVCRKDADAAGDRAAKAN